MIMRAYDSLFICPVHRPEVDIPILEGIHVDSILSWQKIELQLLRRAKLVLLVQDPLTNFLGQQGDEESLSAALTTLGSSWSHSPTNAKPELNGDATASSTATCAV